MDKTQQIKEAHPWLSYDEALKVLLYHHQGSMWVQNLERNELERSMEAFTKLFKSKIMKAIIAGLPMARLRISLFESIKIKD